MGKQAHLESQYSTTITIDDMVISSDTRAVLEKPTVVDMPRQVTLAVLALVLDRKRPSSPHFSCEEEQDRQ